MYHEHVHAGLRSWRKRCRPRKAVRVPDRLVTVTARSGSFSIIAGVTTELVRETARRQPLSPTSSAALGRLLTASALLGTSLKGKERLTLQIVGSGPIGALVAESWLLDAETIGVRGYARHPEAEMPLNERGKFDVGGVVGNGRLQVTRSFEIGQPYVGVVPLASGEIGDDVATYLRDSEQIPSVVALGVLVRSAGVAAAGGAIAQLLPGADEATISGLETTANALTPVATQVADGAGPEDVARSLAGSLPLKTFTAYGVRFACRCTRERVEIAMLGLGRDELAKLRDEPAAPEATCEFCHDRYYFSTEEIDAMIARLERRRLD